MSKRNAQRGSTQQSPKPAAGVGVVAQQATDQELVRRFQQGDEDAFARFVQRHQDRLYRLALVWLGDRALAYDATQETFLRSYTGLGRFRFRAQPGTWLVRVCRNVCLEIRRKRGTVVDHEIAVARFDAEVPEEASYSGLPADEPTPVSLADVLASLAPQQRDVLVLRILEEYSTKDTARIMGCREGTVKAHLSKATANLRKRWPDLADALAPAEVAVEEYR